METYQVRHGPGNEDICDNVADEPKIHEDDAVMVVHFVGGEPRRDTSTDASSRLE